MRQVLAVAVFMMMSLVPAFALAESVDAALVPDGTYIVKVEKIVDTQHAIVQMDNGMQTELVAVGGASFSAVKANDSLKISLVKGKVPVLKVQ